MTPADILEQAAQLIERDGWCRGAAKHGRRHCVLGALWEQPSSPARDAAQRAMDKKQSRDLPGLGIADWNDNVCRDAKEAAAFLRAAKARL